MKNKNILDLSEQYNNYIYPKPTENLSEEWIKKNRFQICDPNYCWHRSVSYTHLRAHET